MGNYGLLIIDMQPKFLDDIIHKDSVIESTKNTIEASRDNDMPIYLVKMGYDSDVEERIKDAAIDYSQITKERNNAFSDTDLYQNLEQDNIDNLVIAGINAHACVKKTTEEAVQKYNIITSKDIIGDIISPKEYMDWYQDNTMLFDDHNELIEHIEENNNSFFYF
ncbi:MAG: isochorismatase family protein [Nanobdellota archaeon]